MIESSSLGIIRFLLKTESSLRPIKPIVFLFHPNEILTENTDVAYERRENFFLKYFFVDYMRRNLKLRNLGRNAIVLFEKEIKYFKSSIVEWDIFMRTKSTPLLLITEIFSNVFVDGPSVTIIFCILI